MHSPPSQQTRLQTCRFMYFMCVHVHLHACVCIILWITHVTSSITELNLRLHINHTPNINDNLYRVYIYIYIYNVYTNISYPSSATDSWGNTVLLFGLFHKRSKWDGLGNCGNSFNHDVGQNKMICCNRGKKIARTHHLCLNCKGVLVFLCIVEFSLWLRVVVFMFVYEQASVCMCTSETHAGSGGRIQVYMCVIRLRRALRPAAGWRREIKGGGRGTLSWRRF